MPTSNSTARQTSRSSAPLPVVPIDRKYLRGSPLPQPRVEGDKEARGRVLVIGGARQMPGPIILSAIAAMRAGAGKLQIVAVAGVACHVATAVPEALVHGLPEARDGSFAAAASAALQRICASSQSILLGPGMLENRAMITLAAEVLRGLRDDQTLVLDAGALAVFADRRPSPKPKGRAGVHASSHALHTAGTVIITPHAGEMAMLLGRSKDDVQARPLATVVEAARRLGVIAVLKGSETLISDGRITVANRAGNVGLATSGSGDVLAGIIAGLSARGATAFQAAALGVHLHARAGEVLARKVGPLGYLAREIMAEIPALMSSLPGAA